MMIVKSVKNEICDSRLRPGLECSLGDAIGMHCNNHRDVFIYFEKYRQTVGFSRVSRYT